MIIILALLIFILNSTYVNGQTATESGSPLLDQVTENVRKRIQDVVKDKNILSLSQETAYIGLLQSVTNNTLSILTDNGTQLASISSKTKITKLPGYQNLNAGDLALDGYIATIGIIPQSDQVMDTTQVVIQDVAPVASTDKHFYGLISQYSTESFLLTLQNPQSNQTQSFLIGRKTNLNQWVNDGSKNILKRTQSLAPNTPVIVIYSTAAAPDGGDLALEVLLQPTPNLE